MILRKKTKKTKAVIEVRDTMMRTLVLSLLLGVTAVCSQQGAPEPAVIKSGPEDIEHFAAAVKKDKIVKFVCEVGGTPMPTISWYKTKKDDTVVEVRPGDRAQGYEHMFIRRAGQELHFNQVKTSDEGHYQCKARNDYGGDMSTMAQLRVYKISLETLDAKMAPISNLVGTKMEVPCEPFLENNFPLPETNFAWVLPDESQKTKSEIISLEKGRIQQVPVNAETIERGIASKLIYAYTEEGDFSLRNTHITCQQRNGAYGITTDSYKYPINADTSRTAPDKQPLELVYPPPPHDKPWSRKVLVGSSFSLKAIFISKPLPQYYPWDVPNAAVEAGDKSDKNSETRTGNELRLFNAGPDHEGEYRLCATADGQEGCAVFHVEVQYPPDFSDFDRPSDTKVVVGQSAEFRCAGKALPPSVKDPKWYINGEPAANTDHIVLLPDPTRLKIINARKPEEIMRAQCVLTNEVGYAVMSASLIVMNNFEWADGQPPSQHYTVDKSNEEETFTFQCNFMADPAEEVSVTWYHNVPADEQPSERYKLKNLPGYKIDGLGATLAIDLTQSNVGEKPRDAYGGTYTCLVEAKNRIYAANELFASHSLKFKSDAGAVAPVAAASMIWILGPIVAGIIVLIIIILIICMIHRNRTVAYRVGEKEIKAGHDPAQDLMDSGFQDFTRSKDGPTSGLLKDPEAAPESDESDDGSLQEYGDIDAGKFNEDGSFIGQYGDEVKKTRPTDSVA